MDRDETLETDVEELLRRARAGDQGAMEALFARVQTALNRWAARDLRAARDGIARPSDVAQEAALLAFRKLETFDGCTAGELFAWLRVIFRNHAAQTIRDARRQKRDDRGALSLDSPEAMEAVSPQKSPSQAATLQEDWRRLFGRIHLLPDEQRQAIWLCHLKEMPVAAVAATMGKSETAVAGLLQRGLRTLRARMTGADSADKAREVEPIPAPLDEAASALLTYLRRRDFGEKVDIAAFVAEHPSCAEEVSAMLHWVDRIHAAKPSKVGP